MSGVDKCILDIIYHKHFLHWCRVVFIDQDKNQSIVARLEIPKLLNNIHTYSQNLGYSYFDFEWLRVFQNYRPITEIKRSLSVFNGNFNGEMTIFRHVAHGRQGSPRFKGDPRVGWNELEPNQSILSHSLTWYSKLGHFPIEIPIKKRKRLF